MAENRRPKPDNPSVDEALKNSKTASDIRESEKSNRLIANLTKKVQDSINASGQVSKEIVKSSAKNTADLSISFAKNSANLAKDTAIRTVLINDRSGPDAIDMLFIKTMSAISNANKKSKKDDEPLKKIAVNTKETAIIQGFATESTLSNILSSINKIYEAVSKIIPKKQKSVSPMSTTNFANIPMFDYPSNDNFKTVEDTNQKNVVNKLDEISHNVIPIDTLVKEKTQNKLINKISDLADNIIPFTDITYGKSQKELIQKVDNVEKYVEPIKNIAKESTQLNVVDNLQQINDNISNIGNNTILDDDFDDDIAKESTVIFGVIPTLRGIHESITNLGSTLVKEPTSFLGKMITSIGNNLKESGEYLKNINVLNSVEAKKDLEQIKQTNVLENIFDVENKILHLLDSQYKRMENRKEASDLSKLKDTAFKMDIPPISVDDHIVSANENYEHAKQLKLDQIKKDQEKVYYTMTQTANITGGYLKILGLGIKFFGNLVDVFNPFKKILLVGFAIGAITGFATDAEKFNKLMVSLSNIWKNQLMPAFEYAANEVILPLANMLMDWWKQEGDGIIKAFQWFSDFSANVILWTLDNVLPPVLNGLGMAIKAMVVVIKELWNTATYIVSGVKSLITNSFGSISEYFKNFGESFSKIFSGELSVGQIIGELTKMIANTYKLFFESFDNVVSALSEALGFHEIFGLKAGTTFREVLKKKLTEFMDYILNLIPTIEDIVSLIRDGAKKLYIPDYAIDSILGESKYKETKQKDDVYINPKTVANPKMGAKAAYLEKLSAANNNKAGTIAVVQNNNSTNNTQMGPAPRGRSIGIARVNPRETPLDRKLYFQSDMGSW